MAFAAGIETVARGLRLRRYWGWVAGVCILTLYIPTVFLPLGAVGLWALLTPATRGLFGVGPLTSVSRRPGARSLASVMYRLLLLTITLTAVAMAYVRISGVGMPPYPPVPEPSESRGFTVSRAWLYSLSLRSPPPLWLRLSSPASWFGIAVGPPNEAMQRPRLSAGR